jgi:hypothetical protein
MPFKPSAKAGRITELVLCHHRRAPVQFNSPPGIEGSFFGARRRRRTQSRWVTCVKFKAPYRDEINSSSCCAL